MKLSEFPGYENYQNGEPMRVPLTWLLNNITESCDGYDLEYPEGWHEMMQQKCSDTGFGHLVESILERGFLPEGSIGFEGGEITEGHHRLCASILLGLDEVWISMWGGDVRGNGHIREINAHWNEEVPDPIHL